LPLVALDRSRASGSAGRCEWRRIAVQPTNGRDTPYSQL
jgi:hypothetical protein